MPFRAKCSSVLSWRSVLEFRISSGVVTMTWVDPRRMRPMAALPAKEQLAMSESFG